MPGHRVRGQSELIGAFVFIGVAAVIGVAMIAYTSSIVSNYRSQLDLANALRSDASSIGINIIYYNNASSTLWILLNRVDGSRASYFIAVDTGSGYLPCSNIRFYNPNNDTDGILCNESEDCPTSTQVYSGSLSNVYIPWEGAITDYQRYAKVKGYSTTEPIYICKIENVCNYTSTSGLCYEGTIARLSLPQTSIARILVISLYNNKPYVVGVYEVPLR